MKHVTSSDHKLTINEHNLLSVGSNGVIGAHSASWRIVVSIEHERGPSFLISKLVKICEDILDVLDKDVTVSPTSGESKVFYHKM